MLRGNAIMWHKSALPATESHSVQPRSGLVASPDPCRVHEVLGDGCSPGASRAGMSCWHAYAVRQRLATARVTNLIRNAIVALVGWLPRWLVTTASEHLATGCAARRRLGSRDPQSSYRAAPVAARRH